MLAQLQDEGAARAALFDAAHERAALHALIESLIAAT
jgi:hypothetical protein